MLKVNFLAPFSPLFFLFFSFHLIRQCSHLLSYFFLVLDFISLLALFSCLLISFVFLSVFFFSPKLSIQAPFLLLSFLLFFPSLLIYHLYLIPSSPLSSPLRCTPINHLFFLFFHSILSIPQFLLFCFHSILPIPQFLHHVPSFLPFSFLPFSLFLSPDPVRLGECNQ